MYSPILDTNRDIYIRSLVIYPPYPSKPTTFKVLISFLIISVVYVCFLKIANIGNSGISFINLVTGDKVSDASSQTRAKVIDLVNLEVSYGKVRNPSANFVEVRVLVRVNSPK